jgi:hypothetical protein
MERLEFRSLPGSTSTRGPRIIRYFRQTESGFSRGDGGEVSLRDPVEPRVKRLLRTNRFSVDGTLIETPVSMKSLSPKERAAPANYSTAGGSCRLILG